MKTLLLKVCSCYQLILIMSLALLNIESQFSNTLFLKIVFLNFIGENGLNSFQRSGSAVVSIVCKDSVSHLKSVHLDGLLIVIPDFPSCWGIPQTTTPDFCSNNAKCCFYSSMRRNCNSVVMSVKVICSDWHCVCLRRVRFGQDSVALCVRVFVCVCACAV